MNNNIRELKLQSKFSSAQICNALGIKIKRLNEIASGKIVPTEGERVSISNLFGLTVKEVFPSSGLGDMYGIKSAELKAALQLSDDDFNERIMTRSIKSEKVA